jgi:hypothetical protein
MYRREYFPSDAIKMINESEGKLGSTGKAAHAVAEHLMKGAPGAVLFSQALSAAKGGVRMESVGIGSDGFRDRFKDSPGTANSGWLGKGDMALLLCELLNSDVGQEAMGALDSGVQRVEVHYLNLKKMAKLFGGLGNVDMKHSNWLVTPATSKMEPQTTTNKKGDTVTFMKKVTTPKQVNSLVKTVDLASIHAVLDAMGGRLHLQTLFPDNQTIESHAKWRFGTGTMTLTFEKDGTPKKDFRPG